MNRMYALLFVMLLIILTLASCSNSGPVAEPTATPEPKLEIFEGSNGQKGLRQGGSIVVDAIWDSLWEEEYDGGVCYYVCLNNKRGLLDSKGNVLVEPNTTWKSYPSIIQHYAAFPVEGEKKKDDYRDGKMYYTYPSTKSELVDLKTGTVMCRLPSNYFIDIVGNYIIYYIDKIEIVEKVDPDKNYGSPVNYSYEYKGRGVFDLEKQKVLFSDAYIDDVELYPEVGFIVTKLIKGAKWQPAQFDCFYSLDGKEICRAKDDDTYGIFSIIYHPESNLLLVNKRGNYQFDLFEIDGSEIQNCYIDKEDKKNLNSDPYICEDGRIIEVVNSKNSSSKYCILESPTRNLIPLRGVERINTFCDGMAAVENKKGMWGFINDKGELVYDFIFDKAEDFDNGKASVIYEYSNKTVDKSGSIE